MANLEPILYVASAAYGFGPLYKPADNQYNRKLLDEFDFRPDWTIH